MPSSDQYGLGFGPTMADEAMVTPFTRHVAAWPLAFWKKRLFVGPKLIAPVVATGVELSVIVTVCWTGTPCGELAEIASRPSLKSSFRSSPTSVADTGPAPVPTADVATETTF